ncbi:hypothetical protein BDR04DRAFT_1018586, partial [Suillus decipiens]
KLCVSPTVFDKLIECIQPHTIFYNDSNNSQLPVPIQLMIFLNSVGHCGNAAMTTDLAEWAGVSIGTVYNCFKQVMIAILKHHDNEWHGGFLCIDGTPFNLFQKPGWHGEGFFDKNLNYSLTAQVVILPHHLCIIYYMIGIPGSLHDSNVFG